MKMSPRLRNGLVMVGVGGLIVAFLAFGPVTGRYKNHEPAPVYELAGASITSVQPIIGSTKRDESRSTDDVKANSNQLPLASTSVLQVGFSPGAGGLRVVLNIINGAQREIRLAAYSFTSPDVVKALIAAKRRGVDVKVVADKKGNATNSSSRQALNLLVNNGVSVRLNGKFSIMHDKFIVADRFHVQTGSFNYSRSAESRNSENVLALWNVPELATQYLKHWESRYSDGVSWQSNY